MDVLLLIISAVASILQILLFFKLWSMTNEVKEMHNVVCNRVDITTLEVADFQDYFEKEIVRAKRMIAIGDNNVSLVLKGLRYDTEQYYKANGHTVSPEKRCAERCERIDKLLETL